MSTKTSKVRPDVDDQGPSLPPQTSMALTATFTADECISHINTYAQRACMNLKVNLGGFNQVIQNLLDPNSVFYQTSDHAGGANVALVRACDIGTSEDGFQDLVAALKSYHANPKATRNVVLLLVPQMQKTPSEWDGLNDAVASCNKVVVVPTSEIIRCVGGWHNDLFDPETDKLGAMPYTVEGYRRLGLMIVRVINYLTRLPTKVIAVDCDNTLWKGIAGDTGGADEVQGNLVLMHLLAKRQKENGMLLATFSKNAEPDVKAAFDAHPDWPLKYDDFVAHFVNWEPKGANLRRCAEQLNLGLDSFTFLDDNPVEIAQVESSCPEISMTLHFPNSTDSTPEEIEAFVNTAWPLDAFRMALQADSEKTSQYRAEAQRKAAALATPSTTFAGFIATLNLNIQIAACSTQDEARCLQLSQKSNQFNFTTKRLSVFPPLPMECSVTRVKDKYGGRCGVFFAVSVCPAACACCVKLIDIHGHSL
jgi:FkbH-like protein